MKPFLSATFTLFSLFLLPAVSPQLLPSAFADRTEFSSWDEATTYVRAHYKAETVDTSKSSFITSAEYYEAGGKGYLILGMKGKPYIFRGVPRAVWEGFKAAPSFGTYYQGYIKGRYYFELR